MKRQLSARVEPSGRCVLQWTVDGIWVQPVELLLWLKAIDVYFNKSRTCSLSPFLNLQIFFFFICPSLNVGLTFMFTFDHFWWDYGYVFMFSYTWRQFNCINDHQWQHVHSYHSKQLGMKMHQMANARPTATALLEIPVTRKLQKAPIPRMCSSTFVMSHPDGECTLMEKPQGYGDMNGRAVTFDSSVLHPRLWINDSKGLRPSGLMCSEGLQAARGQKDHGLRRAPWCVGRKKLPCSESRVPPAFSSVVSEIVPPQWD